MLTRDQFLRDLDDLEKLLYNMKSEERSMRLKYGLLLKLMKNNSLDSIKNKIRTIEDFIKQGRELAETVPEYDINFEIQANTLIEKIKNL